MPVAIAVYAESAQTPTKNTHVIQNLTASKYVVKINEQFIIDEAEHELLGRIQITGKRVAVKYLTYYDMNSKHLVNLDLDKSDIVLDVELLMKDMPGSTIYAPAKPRFDKTLVDRTNTQFAKAGAFVIRVSYSDVVTNTTIHSNYILINVISDNPASFYKP